MHAQAIIVGCSIALFVPGIVCGIVGGGERRGPPKRPRWAAVGHGLVGAAFLLFGSLNGGFTLWSPRPEVSGFVVHLDRHFGRSASSKFEILAATGLSPRLHTDYHGPKIVEGDMARVKYLEYDGAVVELTMLSGMQQGWKLQESTGIFLDLLLVLIGLAGLYEARHHWRA